MAILTGEVEWACIQQPNTKFEPCWCIDILVDAKQAKDYAAAAKKVSAKGTTKPKKESDGRYRIKISRDTIMSTGDAATQPVIRDKANRDLTVLVGNGSICKVQYRFYEWSNGYGKGTGVDLKGVQVLELVEYGEPDGEEFGNEANEGEASDDFVNETETVQESTSTTQDSTETFDDDDF